MIDLQDRDIQILKTCYEQQFLLIDHVQHFYPGYWGEAYRRVREMKRSGFVAYEYHPVLGRSSVIRLTQSGEATVLQKTGRHIIPPLRKLNPNTLIHDALVTSVRLRLSQFWNASFIPERSIKPKEIPEVPDGIFFFPSKKGVAIEIENSDKGRFRFQKLLDRWKFHPAIGAVLYVAATPEMFRILNSYLQGAHLSVDPLIGIVSWPELKVGMPLVTTHIGEVNLFSKKELFT